eukprot:CAMPEP_0114498560 /NCGR_PEP_ID=MMETSP0109-20121206/6939_1 /TAXON_ID=29199 /ORGANISM="Chlorarachnion reptans, Strain CCCM449" /LENGTH=398 /DNA_ID=CAMNT_0001676049 /DNA_START=253 /DNA_END=1449 /DNA_ORIENTATION=+
MTETTMVPAGSTTKSWTAVGVLQAAEQGKLKLSDTIAQYLDPILGRLNSTSLSQLWGEGVLDNCTIDHLLSMKAGIQDYNNTAILLETLYAKIPIDITPIDFINMVDKTLVCPVGSCVYYSSINYMMLGLILVQIHGLNNWEDFNQKSIIPDALADRYKHVIFPLSGACSKHPNVSHQYWHYSQSYSVIYEYNMFVDLYEESCLNGWTCGNIAASGESLANFWYDLGSLKLVNNASFQSMVEFQPLVNDWCPGCYYGKGLILIPGEWKPMDPNVPWQETALLGHPGEDWGSGTSPICGGNAKYKFGVCMAYNSVFGMNCSLPDIRNNRYMNPDTGCEVYAAVLSVVTGKPNYLNCTRDEYKPPGPIPICEWKHRLEREPSGFQITGDKRLLERIPDVV